MKAYKIKKNKNRQLVYIPMTINLDFEKKEPKFPYLIFWNVHTPQSIDVKKIIIEPSPVQ